MTDDAVAFPMLRLRALAESQGETLAFIDGKGSGLTYAAWYARAMSLESALRRQFRPGSAIVAHLPGAGDAEIAPLLCASLAAGVWLAPIVAHASPEYVERVAVDTKAVRVLDRRWTRQAVAWRSETPWLARLGPAGHDGGIVVYTSGSTGMPRGVACDAEDVCGWLQSAGPSVAAGFLTQFRLDSIGGLYGLSEAFRRHPVARVSTKDVRGLARLLSTYRPLGLALMPSGMQSLRSWQGTLDGEARRGVRSLLLSGGRSGVRDLRLARELFGNAVITNVYTSTEAGSAATAKAYTPHDDLPPESSMAGRSVGRPTPGTEVRIVDREGETVGEGVEGHVWMRHGAHRPRSYRTICSEGSDSTAFRRDGWVDTGDWGTVRDGELFLSGRVDDAIFVGGRRVSCDLVEATLREHPDVVDAVALGVDDRLVAAVVARSACGEVEMRRFVGRRLGVTHTPRDVLVLSEIPLTPGGKIDRTGLAKAVRTRAARGAGR